MRKIAAFLATCLVFLGLAVNPASANSYAHTWHSCQHSVAAFGSGQGMTSAQTYRYCYTIGVRNVSRAPSGATVTEAWTISTSPEKRNVYDNPIPGNVPLRTHHFVQDAFGTREYHTCWPGIPQCVAGVV